MERIHIPTVFGKKLPNIKKYWWLRSPSTIFGVGDVAWYVTSSGVVDSFYSNIDLSYGRPISSDSFMHYNYTSFYVMEDGSMITYAVEYSYGLRSRQFLNLHK